MSQNNVKCPWCGRMVSWHRSRLPRHVQSQHVQCVGSGQPQHQVEAQVRLHAEVLAENARMSMVPSWVEASDRDEVKAVVKLHAEDGTMVQVVIIGGRRELRAMLAPGYCFQPDLHELVQDRNHHPSGRTSVADAVADAKGFEPVSRCGTDCCCREAAR